ncbi:potassium channel [Mactra antiquata]
MDCLNRDGGYGGKRKKSKGGLGMSGMVSALIPGAQIDKKGRVMVNMAFDKETLIFNIGGVMFETYKATLFRIPNSPLANDKFLQDHYRPDKKDYFFDRDPDIFRATLNYLRTGELHIPSYICGPAAKNELEYWGIKPNKIERCCWTNYNDWNSTLEALHQLDQDRKGSMMAEEIDTNKKRTWWNTNQPKIWNFFSRPDSSAPAKFFGFLSLFFVVLSIFSFIAGTTSAFQNDKLIPVLNHNDSANSSDVTTGSVLNDTNVIINGSDVNINETDDNVAERWIKVRHPSLQIIDIVCLVFFVVEYIVRLVFAPKKLNFVTSVMGAIDLVAILPDVIEIIIYAAKPEMMQDSSAADVIDILRITRVLRIFRLIKHVPGLWILVYTLKASVGELILLSCFMIVGILLFSSLIYFVENRDNIESIPHAFWWAIITMTTVGYGDMYPVTILGKLVGSLCAMSGLLMIGFSVPALVNNFMLFYKHLQFALQAEREKRSERKNSKSDFKASIRSNNQQRMSQKNGFTDDNDNREEGVSLLAVHINGTEGENV